MTRLFFPLLLCLCLFACGEKAGGPRAAMELPVVDMNRVTVSGVSSGAYMAGQLHVAHSELVSGAGLIAGGPYGCAQNSMSKALDVCIKGGDFDMQTLLDNTRSAAAAGLIDSLDNLSDDTVWLFHGTNDAAVARDVVDAAEQYYAELVPSRNIKVTDSVKAAHGIPTLDYGAECDQFEEPYLQNCNYDAAGEMLNHLLGTLQPRRAAKSDLLSFDQRAFVDAEMLDEGFIYVPKSCFDEPCGLHVVLHGCKQSAEFIGDALAANAGYNEWAESNSLVVLYPQVASSRLAPLNPLGCWDWWGYTGDDYMNRNGPQIRALYQMISSLSGQTP